MRAGGCTVQQALTAEAAAVVKQAVSLARRRGNAQVTPLHVASAMLQAPAGLLRAACLRSHSHPLQCKALELCFNVALNRLPASAGASPLLGGHHVYYPPSLSNALVAAFKRAQAHQRRGSVETQQQPVLAVKIELEQLVISILDDPSVSRVMREAGFSSTQVKANVEQAVSSIDATKPCATAAPQNPNPSAAGAAAGSSSPVHQEAKPSSLSLDQVVREEDVAAILDCLATRSKKRVMVVAECADAAEAAARAAVDRIRRGEARQHAQAQVVSLTVSRFRGAPKDEAERRLAELRWAVRAAAGGSGRAVVLFVEDLAWAAEFWAGRRPPSCGASYYYCAVEHAVAEVRALACRGGGVWLVGHGTYQTNMRCRAGHPSLESVWGLQTLAVPAGSLALSLTCADADDDSGGAMAAVNHKSAKGANGSTTTSPCLSLLDAAAGGACSSGQAMAAVSAACCAGDCAATTKALPRSVVIMPPSTTTIIPPWLHHCRDQEPAAHMKKWMSAHGGSPSRRTALNISSTVVSPCSSVSSYEQYNRLHHAYQPWLVADDDVEAEETKHPWRYRCRGDVVGDGGARLVPAAKVLKSDDSSASNGSVEVECRSRFKEVSAENLKVLCGALDKEVPWQKEIVPEIASTVLRCRSGMVMARRSSSKEHTWMLFLGGDVDGKVRVVRELASLVFGSSKSFVSIGGVNGNASSSSSPSPVRSGSTELEQPHRSKRPWAETTMTTTSGRDQDHLEALYDAVRDNPRRVILMEHVDRADARCQQGIRDAIERGVVSSRCDGGEEAVLGDAIVVLSCERLDSSSTTLAMIKKVKTDKSTSGEKLNEDDDHHGKEAVAAAASSSCFDLNMSMESGDEAAEERCTGEEAGHQYHQLLLKAVDRVLFFRSIGE